MSPRPFRRRLRHVSQAAGSDVTAETQFRVDGDDVDFVLRAHFDVSARTSGSLSSPKRASGLAHILGICAHIVIQFGRRAKTKARGRRWHGIPAAMASAAIVGAESQLSALLCMSAAGRTLACPGRSIPASCAAVINSNSRRLPAHPKHPRQEHPRNNTSCPLRIRGPRRTGSSRLVHRAFTLPPSSTYVVARSHVCFPLAPRHTRIRLK